MKNILIFAGLLSLLASGACAQKGESNGGGDAPEIKNEMDSISYVLGTSLGKNVRQANIEGIDLDLVMDGLKDGLESDSAFKIPFEEGNMLVQNYAKRQQQKVAAEAVEEAKAYMAKKKSEGDLKSTESGILYEVEVKGDGPTPSKEDKVKVHYEGRTTDGEVFDSSYERGSPAEFPLNRVIPGWTEILQLMPVGSTWIVTIPPSLAYGERGSPPNIGPNEVLIFKIELIDIITEEK
ncbi:MAG TPA: FKBP-type peptidyl-prolyl cis-trans isomerase [Cryomorphaceae bacterium]|nr:FKBP-type peptidyl-prolyl cis-trans isomerase [Cryomorphaceae bacterium]